MRGVLSLLLLHFLNGCANDVFGFLSGNPSTGLPPQVSRRSERVFDLTLDANKQLGLQLGAGLEVIGFHKENGSSGQAEKSGMVRPGDRLVGLNGRSLSKVPAAQVAQMLQEANKLVLRFQIQIAQSLDERLDPLSVVNNNTGRIEVLVSGKWERFRVLSEASFASPSSSCDVVLITQARPIDLCNTDDVNASVLFELNSNKILVARRGGCSFHAKAAMASNLGAKGVVIVNTEDRVFRMESDELFGSTVVTIPIAMISKTEGEKLLKRLDSRRQTVAKFVTSERCLNFHLSNETTGHNRSPPDLKTLRENDLALGGYLHLAGGEVIDFITARFGGLLDLNTRYDISLAAHSMEDQACLLTPTEITPLIESSDFLTELSRFAKDSSCSCLLIHMELSELDEMTNTALPSFLTTPVLVISSRGYAILLAQLMQRTTVRMHIQADSTVLANWKELEEVKKRITTISSLEGGQQLRITGRLKRRYGHSACQLDFVTKLISTLHFA